MKKNKSKIELYRESQRIKDKICTNCGEFMPRYKGLYCSEDCRRLANKRKKL